MGNSESSTAVSDSQAIYIGKQRVDNYIYPVTLYAMGKAPNLLDHTTSVRAPHHLVYIKNKKYRKNCIVCKCIHNKFVKAEYGCGDINCTKFGFCFSHHVDHFKLWHSDKCDYLRSYSK